MSVTLRELGLTYPEGYYVTDLFDGVDYGIAVRPDKRFKVDVNPSGIVLVRCGVNAASPKSGRRKLQGSFVPFRSPAAFRFGGGFL